MVVYLLHAYDYCSDDPMICLCLGIASAGRAMQRQSDNRHHLVVQVRVSIIKHSLCTSYFSSRLWLFFRNIEIYVEKMLKGCVRLNIILGGCFINLAGVLLLYSDNPFH